MRTFMDPASVALIGTPRRTGAGAQQRGDDVWLRLSRGRIYPVNPAGGDILGMKIHPAPGRHPRARRSCRLPVEAAGMGGGGLRRLHPGRHPARDRHQPGR